MSARTDILQSLTDAGIEHSIVEHPPAETTEQADAFIEGHEGVRTKSLFLVNRKRTRSYLVIMDDQKPLDLKELAERIEESRLSLGSADRLQDALGVEPGVVSPLAMLDPEHRSPVLVFDEEMLEEPILTFHPGENTATVFVGTQDLLRLLTDSGVEHRTLRI